MTALLLASALVPLPPELGFSTSELRAVYAPSGAYTVLVPASWNDRYDWRVSTPGFSVQSLSGGASVGVYHYWEGKKREGLTAEAALEAERALVPESERRGSEGAERVSGRVARRVRRSEGGVELRRVVLPVRGGFYLFLMDAVPEERDEAERVFKLVLATFRLRSRSP